MKERRKVPILWYMCLVTVLIGGCTARYYKLGKETFYSREAAEQAQATQLQNVLKDITPTTNPVGGRTLFVIPTMEHIEQHGILLTDNWALLSREQIEYIKKAEMNNREFMFSALQQRQLFQEVSLLHNNDPQTTPTGDYDYLIYLHNPTPDICGWYITCGNMPRPRPITMDTGKPLGLPRTLSWLDSIEELSRDKQVTSN